MYGVRPEWVIRARLFLDAPGRERDNKVIRHPLFRHTWTYQLNKADRGVEDPGHFFFGMINGRE